MARTRPCGVESDCTSVISPEKRVVKLPISFIVAVKSTTIRRKGVFLPVARIMRSLKFMAQR